MIYYDVSTQQVLDMPIAAEMDFLTLAALCEILVCELIECEDKTWRLALNGKLSFALDRLYAQLQKPVPLQCVPRLASDELPAVEPFCLGSDVLMLTSYCQALSSSLLAGVLTSSQRAGLTGLLFDLLHHLHDNLKAPCYLRTPEGFSDRHGTRVEALC